MNPRFAIPAIAALLVTASATVAAAQPSTGEHPLFEQQPATQSVSREAVRAQIAGHAPAAGEASAHAANTQTASTLSREQVRNQAAGSLQHTTNAAYAG